MHISQSGLRSPACLVWAVLVASAVSAHAAATTEVQWRSSYNEARKEAQEKNRPLLLDFGRENCIWCQKLDSTTFRDPAIVNLMNERFIPLKVSAEANAQLVEALNIQSFPTLVLAGPDGKILETIEGFKEAKAFEDHLQKALGTTVVVAKPAASAPATPAAPAAPADNTPEWMTRDFQEAGKAVSASDYARGLALLKGIIEDGKDRPVQGKAKQLLQEVEQQAANRLARAKQAEDKGQVTEALEILTDLLRTFPGTQSANDGGQRLAAITSKPEIKTDQRTRRARELLAQAREDYRTQQYLCCMDRCEVLASSYADLPEGVEAMQLAAEIKNNPEWVQEACDNLSERLGLLYLSLAETWLKKGQPQQAVICLERVIHAFPGTRQAEAAQVRLAQVQGRPYQPVNFRKKDEKK